ncbi:hypothetical protein [Paracoccus salsus]|uniref:hypothetical protein n=1 Tax=Paracoccus salsus TaxID=2911061 RepID=UPI001F2804A4|nr:hypothetical protein [Paracoccus salsus]MCF3974138.1 hypothetical protein [Paracoccus salsus]
MDHALQAQPAADALIAAVQGASCLGPAYEFVFIVGKALRDAKIRDLGPMTLSPRDPLPGIRNAMGSGTPRRRREAHRAADGRPDRQGELK